MKWLLLALAVFVFSSHAAVLTTTMAPKTTTPKMTTTPKPKMTTTPKPGPKVQFAGRLGIQVLGNSGGIKIFRKNQDKTKFLMLKMSRLETVDKDGKRIPNSPAANVNRDFTWTGPEKKSDFTDANGNKATMWVLKFESNLDAAKGKKKKQGNDVTPVLKMTVKFFNRGVELPYGTDRIQIRNNTMKFEIEVTDWPFPSEDARLSFGLMLDFKGGKSGGLKNKDKPKDGKKPKRKLAMLGEAFAMDMPEVALSDGKLFAAGVKTKAKGNNKVEIDFLLPYAINKLTYDPVAGEVDDVDPQAAPTETTTPAPTSKSGSVRPAFAVLAMLFALVSLA